MRFSHIFTTLLFICCVSVVIPSTLVQEFWFWPKYTLGQKAANYPGPRIDAPVAAATRAWFSAKTYRGHHYFTLTVNDNKLNFKMYDTEGRLKDYLDLEKRSRLARRRALE